MSGELKWDGNHKVEMMSLVKTVVSLEWLCYGDRELKMVDILVPRLANACHSN